MLQLRVQETLKSPRDQTVLRVALSIKFEFCAESEPDAVGQTDSNVVDLRLVFVL